ncbi:MAG: hypothetical protein QXR60_03240 [Candidatus Nanoarchaeia archaeon]
MIAVCEECGIVYEFQGFFPNNMVCFCNSKKFKVIDNQSNY